MSGSDLTVGSQVRTQEMALGAEVTSIGHLTKFYPRHPIESPEHHQESFLSAELGMSTELSTPGCESETKTHKQTEKEVAVSLGPPEADLVTAPVSLFLSSLHQGSQEE